MNMLDSSNATKASISSLPSSAGRSARSESANLCDSRNAGQPCGRAPTPRRSQGDQDGGTGTRSQSPDGRRPAWGPATRGDAQEQQVDESTGEASEEPPDEHQNAHRGTATPSFRSTMRSNRSLSTTWLMIRTVRPGGRRCATAPESSDIVPVEAGVRLVDENHLGVGHQRQAKVWPGTSGSCGALLAGSQARREAVRC